MNRTWTKLVSAFWLACLALAGSLILVDRLPAVVRAAPAQVTDDFQIDLIEVADGFAKPVQVTHAGDGSGRLFVVEQGGRIKIWKDGVITPFLDISNLIVNGGERGLLGLAFHPDYENNGRFYVNYTRNGAGEAEGDTVIARYRVSADPDAADPATASPFLIIDQPANNHNGGQLLFSPVDGYLYIGMGDGGGSNDTYANAQNKNTLLGAMLRLGVAEAGGVATYTIPAGNPYVGVAGADEIWAIGLRNPWRFSFDRETGDLYIGDVGQGSWEEISYQAAGTAGGLNFGWPCREGKHDTSSNDPSGCSGPFTDPIAEYPHEGDNIAVTGGFVYRGTLYPALQGYYFFADYGLGRIWSMRKTGSNPDTWSDPELELDTNLNISAFGEDESGELYVVDYGGAIYRLADVNGPSPNLSSSRKTASTLAADPGEVVTYSIHLVNTGGLSTVTAYLTDTLPISLNYVAGTLTATHGQVDASAGTVLYWSGSLTGVRNITITYQVTPSVVTGALVNQAQVRGANFAPVTLTASILAPRSLLDHVIYLPLVVK